MATVGDRPTMKKLVRRFRSASNARAIALLSLDLTLFALALVLTVVVHDPVTKLLFGTLIGLQVARLFIIGHDACHQCFVSNRDWNRRIGWLAFLPSLTSYSLWEAGHNLGHHVYTNLRGRDYVWTPMSKGEYDALPMHGRLLQRFYRSGIGYGAYYCIELWWKKLFFPSAIDMPGRRPVHRRDSAIVAAFGLFWIVSLMLAAVTTDQSPVLMVAAAFLWPLMLWSLIMGAAIYFHHTHPDLAWYEDIDVWEAQRDGLSSTVNVRLPGRLGWILNNIMTHPAHHLDVRIPLYRIDAAQGALEGIEILQQPLTLAYMVDCMRRCKLYDYDNRRWMDFEGRHTTAASG